MEGQLFDNKALKKLILPLIVEQALAILVGMVDTVMVASVGETAVSAVSLVDNINCLLINIFSALATGGAVIISQYLGKRDTKMAVKASKQLLYSITAIAMLLMILSVVFNKIIINFLFGKAEREIMENAYIYFYITALSYPFLAIYNSGAAIQRSMGNSRTSMNVSLIVNLFNFFGNAIGIYVLKMGVAGAAMSTLLSRILGGIIISFLCCDKSKEVYFEKIFNYRYDSNITGKILKIGIPTGIENGVFQIGKILVTSLVSTLGTAAISANAVCGSVGGLSAIPGAAIGLALITVVGQCIGADEYNQISYYVKKLMIIAIASIIIINAGVIIFLKQLVGFFNLSETAAELSVFILSWYSILSSFMWPLAFSFPNVLRAAGDTKFTMTASILSMFVMRVGSSYILCYCFNMGLNGVWIGMYLDWTLRIILFVYRYKTGKWRQNCII